MKDLIMETIDCIAKRDMDIEGKLIQNRYKNNI